MDALYRDSQFVIQPSGATAGGVSLPNGSLGPVGGNYVLTSGGHPSSSSSAVAVACLLGRGSGTGNGPNYSAIAGPLPGQGEKYCRRVGLLDQGDYTGIGAPELEHHYLHHLKTGADCNGLGELAIELTIDPSQPPPLPPPPQSLVGPGVGGVALVGGGGVAGSSLSGGSSSQTNSQSSTAPSVNSSNAIDGYATLRSHQIILVSFSSFLRSLSLLLNRFLFFFLFPSPHSLIQSFFFPSFKID